LTVLATPAFGAKSGGRPGSATIAFATAGASIDPTAGSQVSFAVTANVKPADVYSLWVANVCSQDGVTISTQYAPVQDWTAGPFTLPSAGAQCNAFVWLFPDAWTPLKGGSMTFTVTG
jgi:hypothetical protein